MTDQEKLNSILQNGEHLTLECKKAANEIPKDLWETYSSFANTHGGTILLGIEENLKEFDRAKRFTVLGVSNPNKRKKEFWDTMNGEKVSANILLDQDVQILNIDDKSVLQIDIPRASYHFRPVYINGNPFKGTFRRNYEGDYHCSEDEVRSMLQDSSDQGLDGAVLEGYTMADIDLNSLHAYRNEFEVQNRGHIFNTYSDEDFLLHIGGFARNRQTGQEFLTEAGLLMFGKGLSIRERFSALFMDYLNQAKMMPGQRWSDRLTIDGQWENNLYTFVHLILPRLTRDLPAPFQLDGMTRVDDTDTHKAIREAVINMVIHANYRTSGSLRVVRYEDNLLFSNPGNLKIPVSEIFKGGHTSARNPKIQQMFRMIGLCDNIGSGIPTILKIWKEKGWQEPDLYDNVTLQQVELRLWLTAGLSSNTEKDLINRLGPNVFHSLSENEKMILSIALNEKQVTVRRMEPVLKLDPVEISSLLQELTAQKILICHQQHRSSFYTFNENLISYRDTDTTPPTVPDSESATNADMNTTDHAILALFSRYETLTLVQICDEIDSLNTVQSASKAANRLVKMNLISKGKAGRKVVFRKKS